MNFININIYISLMADAICVIFLFCRNEVLSRVARKYGKAIVKYYFDSFIQTQPEEAGCKGLSRQFYVLQALYITA